MEPKTRRAARQHVGKLAPLSRNQFRVPDVVASTAYVVATCKYYEASIVILINKLLAVERFRFHSIIGAHRLVNFVWETLEQLGKGQENVLTGHCERRLDFRG